MLIRSDDLDELREGWRIVQADWAATIERIRRTPGIERRSVNGEYSPIETLRHLLFASDVWFRRGALGEETPYPAIGLAGRLAGAGGAARGRRRASTATRTRPSTRCWRRGPSASTR